MGKTKELLEGLHEDHLEEQIYRQALEWEWEQREMEAINRMQGQVHIQLPKTKQSEHEQSDDQFNPLSF